jgi:1-acyl-sn-glycerol-3-phosphate acyltransferase
MMRLFWRCQVTGHHHIPATGPALVVSNHPSYLDPMFIVCMGIRFRWRLVRFMAWDKLFRIPFVGFILRSYGAWAVNLERPGRAPYEQLVRTLRSGQMAGIFPEGGRSQGDIMGDWKPGALRAALAADVPVLPVTMLGAGRAWPIGAWFPRIWRRVDVVVHPIMRLNQIVARQDGEPEKAWLGRAEAALRDIINRPMVRALRDRKAGMLRAFRQATPPARRVLGQKALMRDVQAPMLPRRRRLAGE